MRPARKIEAFIPVYSHPEPVWIGRVARVLVIASLFLAAAGTYAQLEHWFLKSLEQTNLPQTAEATWGRSSDDRPLDIGRSRNANANQNRRRK